ncbi:TDRKH-like protein [Mya arenaria]|uniref:TDRKH-like protein n=1 Tax=Mya arenaria TaxID=6604 RepID=A0ABY7EJK7_MYAAR|nr:TDRKH-like protein [Mya arenaria]
MFELNHTGRLIILGVALPTSACLLYWLLRTSNDGDEAELGCGQTAETQTSRQTVIEVSIPPGIVGSIIGRRGANIKQLQEESGARLNFKDFTGPGGEGDRDRILVIRGTAMCAQAAECLVRKMLADQPVPTQEIIYVPQYTLGRIIGRGGEGIRQLQRSSNARIDVERIRDEDRNQPRKITITASDAQITIAKGLIQEKLQEVEECRAQAAVSAANRETRQPTRGGRTESNNNGLDQSDLLGQKLGGGDVLNSQPDRWRGDRDISEPESGDGDKCQPMGGDRSTGVPLQQQLGPRFPQEKGVDFEVGRSAETVEFPRGLDYVEVYVSAIADPHHLWLQLIGEMADSAVDHVTVGDLVAAPFENDKTWYRARVMEIRGANELDIFYADYGDSAYAIECRLHGVQPPSDGWGERLFERLEELTHCAQWWRMLARLDGWVGNVPSVTLFDTNQDMDVIVNEELIQNGLAIRDTSTVPQHAFTPLVYISRTLNIRHSLFDLSLIFIHPFIHPYPSIHPSIQFVRSFVHSFIHSFNSFNPSKSQSVKKMIRYHFQHARVLHIVLILLAMCSPSSGQSGGPGLHGGVLDRAMSGGHHGTTDRQRAGEPRSIGESFLLTRLQQGDVDAFRRLSELRQSVDTPLTLMREFFSLFRQPLGVSRAGIAGLLQNIAVARGLVPNSHAFDVPRSQFGNVAPSVINPSSVFSPRQDTTTSSLSRAFPVLFIPEASPPPATTTPPMPVTTLDTLAVPFNVMPTGTPPNIDPSSDNIIWIEGDSPTEEPIVRHNPAIFQPQPPFIRPMIQRAPVQSTVPFITTTTAQPLFQVETPRIESNEAVRSTSSTNKRQNEVTRGPRPSIVTWNRLRPLTPSKQNIRPQFQGGQNVDPRLQSGHHIRPSGQTRRPRVEHKGHDIVAEYDFIQNELNKPLSSIVLGLHNRDVFNDTFIHGIQPSSFMDPPPFDVRPTNPPFMENNPLPDSQKTSRAIDDVTGRIIEFSAGVPVTNRSAFVINSNRTAQLDLFVDQHELPFTDVVQKAAATSGFILQEVGELNLQPTNFTYQLVGQTNMTAPDLVIRNVGELDLGERRQFLMHMDGNETSGKQQVLVQRVGHTNVVPGERIAMHGEGEFRLVTRERVLLERVGFVRFQPLMNQSSDVIADSLRVPVLRVEPLPGDPVQTSAGRWPEGDVQFLGGASAGDNTTTLLQFVSDIFGSP